MQSFITNIAVVIALLFILNPASAVEDIDGAFGIELGQKFEPASAIGEGELTDGTPMYQFKPKNSFRSFSKYYVLISPISYAVYSIWGIGEMENTSVCNKEQEVIMSILKSKYGEEKKDNISFALRDVKIIDQGNRSILIKCNGFISNITIDIRYYDREIQKLANEERIKVETKKVDASGL